MTAVSDLEVVSEEESGHMWEIRYPLVQNENNKTSYQDVYKFKKLLNECSIYEDENFVAINKPPGLAVQGGSKVKNSICF